MTLASTTPVPLLLCRFDAWLAAEIAEAEDESTVHSLGGTQSRDLFQACLGSMRAGDIDCSADEILMMTYMHWSVLFSSRMKGLVWEALSQVSSVQSGCGTFCHQCPDFWRAVLLFATQVR